MNSAPAISASETVSANLRMILRGLLTVLGAWRMEPVLVVVLHRRINVTMGQIERMLVRFRAGRLWLMPQRIFAAGPKICREPAVQLPRRFGWLVKLGGHHASCVSSQLQAVVNTPEMTELLAVSVQAQRILRPLCRALAVELPGMAGAPRKVTTRKIRPRVKPEPFRIPLPRGVLTAARRQGFGKLR